MKTALRVAATFFLHILFQSSYAQTGLQSQAIVLKRMIEINHITPRPVDDQFSADFLDQFISNLDPGKLYFTQTDVDGFNKYRATLDDELQNKGWSFFPSFLAVYKKRLQQADSLIVQLTQKPFDFNIPGQFAASSAYARNEGELKTRWSQYLRYKVLSGLSTIAENQLQQKGSIKKEEVLLKEPDIRAKVKNRYRQKIKNILESPSGFEQQCEHEFLSALTTCFDPHTNFFNLKGMKDFETSLNTEGYYFGFSLADNDKHEIIISNLMPGSAAWKCGQLNKDDVVLQIQWEGQEPVDLTESTAEEVDEMIDESKKTKITLTVRKANGMVSSVSLEKEKVENDDQHVKSFILSGKRKIGYIYLPGFYTEWESAGGSSCAADMAKEIVKLKKDGIEGIILDVRFNGGGSMQEAIELAGIFIEEGPLCQFKTRDGKVTTLKDVNRGTIWDGPLLMLVNGQSASASELVAAVLQDYNRAIIAGSVTHGKGTGQQIVPVDTSVNLLKERPSFNLNNSSKGFIKITNGRLYRVTGQTVQGSGVQPDIVLPDVFNKEEWHESHLPFYLKPDTVKRNAYYKPLSPLSLNSLQQASSARIKSNEKFAILNELGKDIGAANNEEIVSLKWEETEKTLISEFNLEQKQKKIFTQQTTIYTASNHSFDKETVASQPMNKIWLDRLMQDLYVEECYQILNDFIQNK
jgi:carboxyl-terminal processing protease